MRTWYFLILTHQTSDNSVTEQYIICTFILRTLRLQDYLKMLMFWKCGSCQPWPMQQSEVKPTLHTKSPQNVLLLYRKESVTLTLFERYIKTWYIVLAHTSSSTTVRQNCVEFVCFRHRAHLVGIGGHLFPLLASGRVFIFSHLIPLGCWALSPLQNMVQFTELSW